MALIELESVVKTYTMGKNSFDALKGVSLSIEKGEFVAFMGESGSGKSSIMNIIGCLDRPSSGIHRFDGIEANTLDDDQMAYVRSRRIGFIYQNFNLLPQFTALENAAMPLLYTDVPASDRKKRATEALTMVGLAKWSHHKPTELSGGQQQRVAIARALVKDPIIIFGDELTGNVDEKTGVEIMTICRNLNDRGVTIVIVTHSNEVAEWADRIIFVKDGKLGGA